MNKTPRTDSEIVDEMAEIMTQSIQKLTAQCIKKRLTQFLPLIKKGLTEKSFENEDDIFSEVQEYIQSSMFYPYPTQNKTVKACFPEIYLEALEMALSQASDIAQGKKIIIPKEPTREMWAEMGDAIAKLRQPIHHDVIAKAVYDAIIKQAIEPIDHDWQVAKMSGEASDSN